MTDTETIARRLAAIDAEIEDLQAARKDLAAMLIAAVGVGGSVAIDGTPAYRVGERKGDFDPAKAREVLPEELIESATLPTLDTKVLRSLMPPALVDACRKPTTLVLSKVKS